MKNTMDVNGKEKLTVSQVCEELQISKSTFNKWRMTGRAPTCKRMPNGSLRILRQDLDAWFDEVCQSDVA
jgi:predicted site-specific integrase-resolvase